jgi:hypothetical protein
MRRRVGAAWGTACVVIACGGHQSAPGTTGSASVTGGVSGNAIPTSDTIGLVGTTRDNGTTQPMAGALLANVAGLCQALQDGDTPGSSQVLSIRVIGASGAVGPGTYPLNATGGVGGAASFLVRDQNCTPTLQSAATQGAVTLTTVTSDTVAGSFDVTFPTGDHVTGTFSGPVCSGGAAGAMTGTCR